MFRWEPTSSPTMPLLDASGTVGRPFSTLLSHRYDRGPEHVDRRRWDGRTGVPCGKQWTKSMAACVKLRACGERIHRMELTWAPTKEDIARCVLGLYSLGAGVTSRLFDVIRAKSYPVDRRSRHVIQMEPRMCSHQPSSPSSWKHSALVEPDPLLPWVPRNLWNRGST
jgi:hypothetical protein